VVFRPAFVVADGASATVGLGEGACHGLSAVQDDEAGLVGEFADERPFLMSRHHTNGPQTVIFHALVNNAIADEQRASR
jgi:hypothetical protein